MIKRLALVAGAALLGANHAHATHFGIICQGANCGPIAVATAAALVNADTIRVNLPLLIGLTDGTNTVYPKSNIPLPNNIAGSVTSGTFIAGEKVTQASTGAFSFVNGTVPTGGPMNTQTIGYGPVGVNGKPPDWTDVWTGNTSGAIFAPSGLPVPVPAYTWAFNGNPHINVGDTVSSWALSPDGSAKGTAHVTAASSSSPWTVTLDTGTYVGIASATTPLGQLTTLNGVGYRTHAVLFNSAGDSINTNRPIRTDTEYTSELTETLNYVASAQILGQPLNTLSIESEEDALSGSLATAQQYLHELTLGVSTGHSLGYTVYNGAPSTNGLNVAWWYYMFYTCGTVQCRQAADIAAPYLFIKSQNQANWTSNTIPTSCNPGGPDRSAQGIGSISGGVLTYTSIISGAVTVGSVVYAPTMPLGVTITSQLSGTPGGVGTYALSDNTETVPSGTTITLNSLGGSKFNLAYKSVTLVNGFAAIGYDYTNFHWYQTNPTIELPVMQWYQAIAGNKPFTLEENGTYNMSAVQVTGHMAAALLMYPDMITWWDNDGTTVALMNPDGTIRPNGSAFKAFATAPGYLIQQLPPQTPCTS